MEEEVLESTEEIVDEVEDSGLPSDEKPKKTYEELEAEYKALADKNAKAEEIAKRLKDEKSQKTREQIEKEKMSESETIKNEVFNQAIVEALENNGVLSEEAMEKAKEAGIDERDLKIKILETKELQSKVEGIVYESAGGKDAYFDMVDAVKENSTEEETNAFKMMLGNPQTAKLAVLALKQRYIELNGQSTDNRIVAKTSSGSNTNGTYTSEAEYFKDKRAADRLSGQARDAMMSKISAKLRRSDIGKH